MRRHFTISCRISHASEAAKVLAQFHLCNLTFESVAHGRFTPWLATQAVKSKYAKVMAATAFVDAMMTEASWAQTSNLWGQDRRCIPTSVRAFSTSIQSEEYALHAHLHSVWCLEERMGEWSVSVHVILKWESTIAAQGVSNLVFYRIHSFVVSVILKWESAIAAHDVSCYVLLFL